LTLDEFESSRFLRVKHVRELQQQGILDGALRRRELLAYEGAGV
jgi:hypothetical protein